MTALGMPSAFSPETAEFPEFCNVPTFIGQMKQAARIKLNEEGTEAAAVTLIGDFVSAVAPSEPQRVQFHATRPFLYVISEQSTGAIFFIGRYMGKTLVFELEYLESLPEYKMLSLTKYWYKDTLLGRIFKNNESEESKK